MKKLIKLKLNALDLSHEQMVNIRGGNISAGSTSYVACRLLSDTQDTPYPHPEDDKCVDTTSPCPITKLENGVPVIVSGTCKFEGGVVGKYYKVLCYCQ